MKYQKKPVVIEAWKEGSREAMPGWLQEAWNNGTVYEDGEGMKVRTLEGVYLVSPGDYIIQGVKGELYPCKPDIFVETYEAVR